MLSNTCIISSLFIYSSSDWYCSLSLYLIAISYTSLFFLYSFFHPSLEFTGLLLAFSLFIYLFPPLLTITPFLSIYHNFSSFSISSLLFIFFFIFNIIVIKAKLCTASRYFFFLSWLPSLYSTSQEYLIVVG